ncbi:MAG: CRISPR-associated CARF protein Csx1 [Elusimicrobiota bacterium]|nr:CRISPR-associated CARF protein Csx1 [Endomicrobiia bacterium]MDW8165535.1 CRISPR-associated CARF protein Csx1 [Elusimicrobiota bacterium]
MKYIYQIGRIDKNILENKKFRIDNEIFEAPLSGIALKEYFKNKKQDVKLVLIYPISLAINKTVTDQKLNPLCDKIAELFHDKTKLNNFIKYPCKFFKCHPHNKYADYFFVVHSIGEYEGINFKTDFSFIVLEIFCDIIKRYIKWEKIQNKDSNFELYIDISTGLNIYITSLIEAARYFVVFQKLRNWDNTKKVTVKIVFSDPIIGSSSQVYNLYFDYQLDVKVFLVSPIKKEDLDFKLARQIFAGEDEKELKQKLNKLLEDFAILFSSVKNTTPLIWFTFKFENSTLLNELIKKCYKIFLSNWQSSYSIDVSCFLKAFLCISFYEGLLRVLKKKGIEFGRGEVSLEDLKNIKSKLKEIFPDLKIELLGNELANLERNRNCFSNCSSWTLLKNFVGGESQEFQPRNFIAHGGFERNIVEVKIENNDLNFRYVDSKDVLDKIKSTLINNL